MRASTVLYSSKGAVELVGRFLYGDATYMRGEGDYVAAGLFCKAIEEAFGRCHDQCAVAAGFADGAGAAVLTAVKRQSEAKHLHGLFDRDAGFQLREIHEGHVSVLLVSGEELPWLILPPGILGADAGRVWKTGGRAAPGRS